jgi:hypothetical protein
MDDAALSFLSIRRFYKWHLPSQQAGQVLWSEPPDVGLLETHYEPFVNILSVMKGDSSEVALTTWKKQDRTDILVSSRIRDDSGEFVGMLVGAIPTDHLQVQAILGRKPSGHVIAQLIDGAELLSRAPILRVNRRCLEIGSQFHVPVGLSWAGRNSNPGNPLWRQLR